MMKVGKLGSEIMDVEELYDIKLQCKINASELFRSSNIQPILDCVYSVLNKSRLLGNTISDNSAVKLYIANDIGEEYSYLNDCCIVVQMIRGMIIRNMNGEVNGIHMYSYGASDARKFKIPSCIDTVTIIMDKTREVDVDIDVDKTEGHKQIQEKTITIEGIKGANVPRVRVHVKDCDIDARAFIDIVVPIDEEMVDLEIESLGKYPVITGIDRTKFIGTGIRTLTLKKAFCTNKFNASKDIITDIYGLSRGHVSPGEQEKLHDIAYGSKNFIADDYGVTIQFDKRCIRIEKYSNYSNYSLGLSIKYNDSILEYLYSYKFSYFYKCALAGEWCEYANVNEEYL